MAMRRFMRALLQVVQLRAHVVQVWVRVRQMLKITPRESSGNPGSCLDPNCTTNDNVMGSEGPLCTGPRNLVHR